MKWLVKITNWIKRETWWRRRYKRITLPEKVAWSGRCPECSATTDELRCDTKSHPCPCKWNQCLKYKSK